MANEANGNLQLTFEISNGDNLIRREEISAESVTIGRGPAAMLRIDDEALADLHAVVNVQEDGTVQILDLGHANGTQVNGEAVSGNASLASGDTISIGPITVAVSIEAVAASAEEATQPVPEEEEEVEKKEEEGYDEEEDEKRAGRGRGKL